MTKTTALPHCDFQNTNTFDLVIFEYDQGHGKEHLAEISFKMHEPISFGLSSKIGNCHDAHVKPCQTKFENSITKVPVHPNMISIDL